MHLIVIVFVTNSHTYYKVKRLIFLIFTSSRRYAVCRFCHVPFTNLLTSHNCLIVDRKNSAFLQST